MERIAIVVKTTNGATWIKPHILEARKRGWEVTVVTPLGDGPLAQMIREMRNNDSGINHVAFSNKFISLNPFKNVANARLLRKVCSINEFNVVMYHLYETAIFCRFALIGSKVLKVHMVPGPLFLESALIRFIEKIAANFDDLIITGSNYTEKKYLSLGVSSKKLKPFTYGVDVEKITPISFEERKTQRETLGIPENHFVVVMVAYFYAPKLLTHRGKGIKGHTELLEAWSAFHNKYPDSELYIVGGGHGEAGSQYRKTLMEEYSNQSKIQSIHWIGTTQNVRKYYSIADVSISPSLSDGHGAAAEASAFGIPSIVTDAGALQENLGDSCGWIIPKEDSEAITEQLIQLATFKHVILHEFGVRAREYLATNLSSTIQAPLIFDAIQDRIASNAPK